jgi:toxin ParE1/3/4
VIRIAFADEAVQDIEEIYAYIAEDNVAAADRHREQLKRRWEQLKDQPRIGRARDDIKPGYRSVTEGAYLILYRIVSLEEVMIMRVVHGRRDLSKT